MALLHIARLGIDTVPKWNAVRACALDAVKGVLPESYEWGQKYFSANPIPSVCEIYPGIIAVCASGELDGPYRDKLVSWILLYLATAIIDDIQDGEIDLNLENFNVAIGLISLASIRIASSVESDGMTSQRLFNLYKEAIAGQFLPLHATAFAEGCVTQIAEKKNALLDVGPMMFSGQIAEVFAHHSRDWRLVVQLFDDMTDIVEDLASGRPSLILMGDNPALRNGADPNAIVGRLLENGAFSRALLMAELRLQRLIGRLRGEACSEAGLSFFTALKNDVYELRVLCDGVSGGESPRGRTIDRAVLVREKIAKLAIGS